LTVEKSYESLGTWRKRIQYEENGYLWSVRKSLDFGIVDKIPVTIDAYADNMIYGSGSKENSRDDFILSFQGKDTSIDTSNRFN
jgi:hypothetical protein